MERLDEILKRGLLEGIKNEKFLVGAIRTRMASEYPFNHFEFMGAISYARDRLHVNREIILSMVVEGRHSMSEERMEERNSECYDTYTRHRLTSLANQVEETYK
ncbi:hypothetical protein GOV11_04640 [Candidatus Woesearchaeota archaeon]|nr:hypothetical protein [Candidatus Woesearchaeota archaeon]